MTLLCTLLHSYPGQQYAGRSGLVAPQATARFPALDSGDAQTFVLPSIACVAMSAAPWSRMISMRSRMLYIYAVSIAHGGKGVAEIDLRLLKILRSMHLAFLFCVVPSTRSLPTTSTLDRFSLFFLRMRAAKSTHACACACEPNGCEVRAGRAIHYFLNGKKTGPMVCRRDHIYEYLLHELAAWHTVAKGPTRNTSASHSRRHRHRPTCLFSILPGLGLVAFYCPTLRCATT